MERNYEDLARRLQDGAFCVIPMWHNQSHPLSHNHLSSYNHLRSSNTAMDIRDSLSNLKKKIKHRVSSSKQKMDRTGSEPGEEGTDRTGSFSRLAPHVVMSGGRNVEVNTDEQQVRSTNRLLPQDVPAHGSDNDQAGVEGSVDGEEPSERYLDTHSDIEVAVGSGPGQEENEVNKEKVGRIHLSPSTHSISISHGPDGMRTWLFHLPLLNVPSDNTGTFTAPYHPPEALCPDKSAEPSAAVGNDKLDWGSTASSTAKLLLRWARDSADAFGPLKSVAGSLCFILQNFEVCSSSIQCCPQHLRFL